MLTAMQVTRKEIGGGTETEMETETETGIGKTETEVGTEAGTGIGATETETRGTETEIGIEIGTAGGTKTTGVWTGAENVRRRKGMKILLLSSYLFVHASVHLSIFYFK